MRSWIKAHKRLLILTAVWVVVFGVLIASIIHDNITARPPPCDCDSAVGRVLEVLPGDDNPDGLPRPGR